MIIYRWQEEEEAGRFPQLVRLVDAFSAGWTEAAQQTNWLLGQLQDCVAKGCTAISQITDTGLAMPAKAAARREQDRLRHLMRQKAQLEGLQSCPYKAGCREILQVAVACRTGWPA